VNGSPFHSKLSLFLRSDHTLLCTREFSLQATEAPIFDTELYLRIKQIFDAIHEADNHILTLKAAEPQAAEN
jgi:hypothetical protein